MLRVERATSEDLEQLLGIAAARRAAYAEYQPQFWRPAPDAVHVVTAISMRRSEPH